mmetsp:Transcript_46409/g.86225  ORF Transcript_46409/g.86225 Transcript_46409/m.86225 type:complete len:262 (-) Transcript_46409:5-790(-)
MRGEEEKKGKEGNLNEGGLERAVLAEVTLEALAKTRAVVADTTARAVTELSDAIRVEVEARAVRAALRIVTRRALLERAVRATEAEFALAAVDLLGIPGGGVDDGSIRRLVGVVNEELLLRLASTMARALVGANGAVAGAAFVSGEALAETSLAVAGTSVGAFGAQVSNVVGEGDINPGLGIGAGAERAVRALPGSDGVALAVNSAVLAGEASAAVEFRATAVAGAGVGARSRRHGDEGKAEDGEKGKAVHGVKINGKNDL